MNLENIKRPLIIYDSQCTLCVRFKQGLIHFSTLTQDNFIPLQEEIVYETFGHLGLTKEKCQKEVHLIDDQNIVYMGPQVVEFLIPIIPAVSKLAWLIDQDKTSKVCEVFYNSINILKKNISTGCRTCGT